MEFGNNRIRVLVAEDNRDLAAAICALIAAEPDMQVTAPWVAPATCSMRPRSKAAQVLVLDLDLGGESSVSALMQLRQSCPAMAIVVYSGYDQRDLSTVLAQTDRCEYVAKTGDPDELIGAIRRAAQGAAGAGN